MHKSPLEFSRYWAELMAVVDQAPDTGLLVLTRIWAELEPHQSDPRFAPYFDEYKGRLESIITEANVRDFGFDDLKQLRGAVSALGLSLQLTVVVHAEAKLWAYVGEPAKAVEVIARLTGESPTLELAHENSNAASEQLLLESTANRLALSALQTTRILSEILAEWQAESSALSHDSAWCMLVQLGPHLGGGWGRLLKLKGDVDLLTRKKVAGNGGPSDQVTFAHQLKSADDPAVGGVYDSIAGIRKALAALGLAKSAREKSWSVRLEFEGGNHQHHGDSLGLAAGLLTYAGLLKDEFLRHERKLSGEVAFTGGVDADGHLTPVNNSTLKDKVARAFFSHLKYLVVPKSNEPAAREVIAHLTAQYPRRRIHLVAAETIGDVVEDRNLVRSEKLCPAAYLVKGARKYSRATKVQVPLLVVLLLLAFMIAYDRSAPESWKPWGDMNPSFADIVGSQLRVYNADSSLIGSWSAPCDGIFLNLPSKSNLRVADVSGDRINDVILHAATENLQTCTARLYAWNWRGEPLFDSKNTRIIGQYFDDNDSLAAYHVAGMYLINCNRSTLIQTILSQNNPARNHVKFFDHTGTVVGTYVNAGPTQFAVPVDINGDGTQELVIAGANVRTAGAALMILPDSGATGASPPYFDSQYDLSQAVRGNQIAYINFPRTQLTDSCFKLHNQQGHGAPGLGTKELPLIMITYEGDTLNEVDYYLDRRLRVHHADFGNGFYINYSARVVKRPRTQINWNALADSLARKVEYWTDSGFVTEGALRAAGQ